MTSQTKSLVKLTESESDLTVSIDGDRFDFKITEIEPGRYRLACIQHPDFSAILKGTPTEDFSRVLISSIDVATILVDKIRGNNVSETNNARKPDEGP